MKKNLFLLIIWVCCISNLIASDSTRIQLAEEWASIITQQMAANEVNTQAGTPQANHYYLDLNAAVDDNFKTVYQNGGDFFWKDNTGQNVATRSAEINQAITNQSSKLGTTQYYVVTASIFNYANTTSFEENVTTIDWAEQLKQKNLTTNAPLVKQGFHQDFFNRLTQKVRTQVTTTNQDYVINYYCTVFTLTPEGKYVISYKSFVNIGSELNGLALSSFDNELKTQMQTDKLSWILKNLYSDAALIKFFKDNGKDMSVVDAANRLGSLTPTQFQFLKDMYGGKKTIGDARTLKCQLFTTSEVSPNYEDERRMCEGFRPAKDRMMLWLHFARGSDVPVVQVVRFGNSEDEAKFAALLRKTKPDEYTGVNDEDAIKQGIRFILDNSLAGNAMTFGDFCAGLYSAMDWLSHGIDHAHIPEYVWKCEDPNYDPRYAKVFRYTIAPMLVFVNPAFAAAFMPGSLCGANPLTSCEFALMCGIWNGLIDAFKALPDGVKLLASAGSNDPKHRDWAMLQESVTAKGGGFTGFAKVVWEGLKTNHNFSQSPCLASHSVGSDIFNIVAAYFTAGGSAVGGTAARTFFTVLDKLDVLGLAVGKFASAAGTVGGFALKTTLTATGRTLTFIAPTTTKLVVNVATDAATQAKTVALKVAAAGAERLMNANDFVRKAVGATEREMFLFDPNFQPNKIVEVVKDGDGLPLKNTDGYTLAFAEDANGNRQMVVLKEAQGILAAGITRTIDKFKDFCGNPSATGQFNTIIENGVSRTVPAFAEIVTVNGTQKLKILSFASTETPYNRIAKIVDDAHYIDDALGTDKIDDILIGIDDQGRAVCIKGACFVAGTPVHTATGLKPIEQIQAGDLVKSYDEKSGQTVLQRVAKTFQKTTARLVRLITGKDTIFATPEHPFYVREDQPDGSNQGKWVSAMDLRRGLKVFLLSGVLMTVDSLFACDTIAAVYNFEVEQTHTYYVGNQGILVHNSYTPFTKLKKWIPELIKVENKLASLGASASQCEAVYKAIAQIENQLNGKKKIKALIEHFEGNDAFAKAIIDDADLMAIHVKFYGLPPVKQWCSASVDLLNALKGKPDDLIQKVKGYYSGSYTKPDIDDLIPPFTHNRVRYDGFGHPNFTSFMPTPLTGQKLVYRPTGTANKLMGTGTDMNRANNWVKNELGLTDADFRYVTSSGTPSPACSIRNPTSPYADASGWVECTWHHHEDGLTMFPVPTSVHTRANAAHTGGRQTIAAGIEGFFSSPTF